MKRPLREYKGQQLKIHETRRENCWQAFGWLVPDWFHRSPISAIEISLLIFRRCAEGERTFSDILHADDRPNRWPHGAIFRTDKAETTFRHATFRIIFRPSPKSKRIYFLTIFFCPLQSHQRVVR